MNGTRAVRQGTAPWVGLVALLIAVGAMAVEHLLGTDGDDDTGLADPGAFAISVVLALVAAALLFGWLVPREQRAAGAAERAARSGLVCSIVSVVLGAAFAWLGFPFVVAGAGVALGLDGISGARRREATAAVAIGAFVLAVGTVGYVVAAIA